MDKTADITSYAHKVGIRVTLPKWGLSRGEYFFDRERKIIAKGLTSIKYMSAGLADELYNLAAKNKYSCFMDLLKDLDEKTSINSRQLDILIKLDFFSDFGNQRELLRMVDLFFNIFKRGQAKQIKKTEVDGTPLEEIVKRYAVGVTKSGGEAKSYTLLDVMSILRGAEDAVKAVGMDDLSDIIKVRNFYDVMGYIGYVSGNEADRRKLYITDMKPLVDTIVDYIPAPTGDPDAGTQVLISTIDYNEYVGRIGVGKVDNGKVVVNEPVVIVNEHDPDRMLKVKIGKLYVYEGLNKVEVNEADIGSIVAISGIADVNIGDTICSPENPDPIPFQKISEPTISMTFMVNDSPFAGKEGKFVTSRHLRDRLFRELNTDVSLRVEETETTEAFKVSGRGELHLSVLIENMRREGYEFAVSKAEVIYKTDERGKKLEPFEIAYIDVPDEFTGTVINMLNSRKGELQGMAPTGNGTTRLEFLVPSRGLIGFRGDFMTATKGNGVINTIFDEYLPYKGDMNYRSQGSLIAYETGTSITYGLFNAQERGTLFIGPGEPVYAGMVIGENGRTDDIEVNVCKKKQLTNTRSSGADDALKLTPPKVLSLEQALDFIDTDELLEITPKSFRIRKKILDPTLRFRAKRDAGNK